MLRTSLSFKEAKSQTYIPVEIMYWDQNYFSRIRCSCWSYSTKGDSIM